MVAASRSSAAASSISRAGRAREREESMRMAARIATAMPLLRALPAIIRPRLADAVAAPLFLHTIAVTFVLALIQLIGRIPAHLVAGLAGRIAAAPGRRRRRRILHQ